MRLLSPIAEGADRLVAEIAAELGYEIDVALPFTRNEYAKDFTTLASRAAFEHWLGPKGEPKTRPHLALDGGRGDIETASYEAIGRLVVRNCDVLIAIWDGRPAMGRGGTGDIVRFALRFGLPVWWIDSTRLSPPRLLRDLADLRVTHDASKDLNSLEALARVVQGMLLPAGHHRHSHGLISYPLHRIFGPTENPLQAYLGGRPPRASFLWRLYGWVYLTLGGAREKTTTSPLSVPAGPAAYWEALYKPADQASTEYANRYRSSYVWVFLLATLAVACAVVALAHAPWKLTATFIETVLLFLILTLVATNERRDWQGRWIEYRLLAELCRKQGALASLGWSLPPTDLRRSLEADRSRDDVRGASHQTPEPGRRESWVGWYFDAALRAAPLPVGDLSGLRLVEIRTYVRTTLVDEQRHYHEDRRIRSRRAGSRLVRFGEISFITTLLLVIAKLLLLVFAGQSVAEDHGEAAGIDVSHFIIVLLGAVAAMLPAASAAFFGVRAYAELELLESQSARMAKLMAAASRRMSSLDLTRPLASQDLAEEVLEVSSAMLQEVGGWADLFRLKAVEAS